MVVVSFDTFLPPDDLFFERSGKVSGIMSGHSLMASQKNQEYKMF